MWESRPRTPLDLVVNLQAFPWDFVDVLGSSQLSGKNGKFLSPCRRQLCPLPTADPTPSCCSSFRAEVGTQSAQGFHPPCYPRRGLTFICSLSGHKFHRPRDSSQACAWPAMPSLLCYSHSIRNQYRIETDACQWAEQDILLLLPCPAASVKPLPAAGSMKNRRLSLPVDSGTCMMPVLYPCSHRSGSHVASLAHVTVKKARLFIRYVLPFSPPRVRRQLCR
jgi:hypothetical protein